MAPERIDGREYSYPSDVWAFGLSLMTVALGRLSIQTSAGYWGFLESIRDREPPRIPEEDTRFSAEFRDLLSQCLRKEPGERSTCRQLLRHEFLRRAVVDDTTEEGAAVAAGETELRAIVTAVHAHLLRLRQRVVLGVRDSEPSLVPSPWMLVKTP
jgi:serine/threonine protein kinase